MDPLSVLREFSVAKQLDQVEVDGNRVKFGERYSFPRNIATGYKRHGGGTYDLHTLVYLLKQPDNYAWLVYVRSAREAGIPQVAFQDRKELLEYLTGAIDRSDKIQLTAPELVLPGAVEEVNEEPSAKRARLNAMDASVSGAAASLDTAPVPVVGRERQLRDRNSQMSIPGKSFRQVLDILHMAQREQARWKAVAASAAKARPPPLKEKKVIPVLPSGRFDRPAEQNPKGAFKINPAAPKEVPPLPLGPPPPPPAGAAPPTSMPSQKRPSSAQERHSSGHHGSRRPGSSSSSKPVVKAGKPIIIVPAAPSARITMFNAGEFLEKGTYKPSEVARKEGAKKESRIIIHRRMGRPSPVPYEVTDKAPDRNSHDWRRVVAVFVTGAAWQFKDWPFKGANSGDMVETFHHILGLHVSLKNEQVTDTVKSWNLQRFKLHPVDRHGDQSVVMEIYNAIDKFMSKKERSGKSYHIVY